MNNVVKSHLALFLANLIYALTFTLAKDIMPGTREAGDQILEVDNLSAHASDGSVLFENLNFKVNMNNLILAGISRYRWLFAFSLEIV